MPIQVHAVQIDVLKFEGIYPLQSGESATADYQFAGFPHTGMLVFRNQGCAFTAWETQPVRPGFSSLIFDRH